MSTVSDSENVFAACKKINELLDNGHEVDARGALVEMLDWHLQERVEYTPIVNHFIRILGLYPYLDTRTSRWEDAFAFESFRVDVGEVVPVVLHREQSRVLRRLVEGESLALSAPTSFGKSFIIDSFIKLTSPKNVLIIVPTLALADEARRRLSRKFGSEYRIITSVENSNADGKAIYIFPQERALSYVDRIESLDLFVVDEFYKASASYDRERSASLIRAIIAFGEKSRQRYFLAPNIASLTENPFTEGMDFVKIDFNTVVLRSHPWFESIGSDFKKKSDALLEVLRKYDEKTLIYVGTYSGISEVVSIILDEIKRIESSALLHDFEEWLIANYGGGWQLPAVVSRGFGIHNGQLHRPLSQIQVKVFEEDAGIYGLISTSSIIEGVNTCAQNVVLWKNKNGSQKLTDFEYRNIIGRSGRMFRHFIGQVYVLEKPPVETDAQLHLELQDSLLGLIDIQDSNYTFSTEQRAGVDKFNAELRRLSGRSFESLRGLKLQTSDSALILKMATDLVDNPAHWAGIAYLNSDIREDWTYSLFKILELGGGVWDTTYTKFVNFIKIYASSWTSDVVSLRNSLAEYDLGVEQMFKLERNLSYKFSSLLGDLNTINRTLNPDATDVSSFVFRASNAFLPHVVYGLEEYGLPRMISRKIHDAGYLDFEDADLTLDDAIVKLLLLKDEIYYRWLPRGLPFDRYILEYFYEGISSVPEARKVEVIDGAR